MEEVARLLGKDVPISFRHSKRAKRVRIHVNHEGVELVLPWRAPKEWGRRALAENQRWVVRMVEQYRARPADDRMLFGGAERNVLLARADVARAELIPTDESIVLVMPRGSHAEPARLLERLLKELAREQIGEACTRWSLALGVSPNRIAIKDTKTRWGSCSRRGNLNFSWRLVMAPPQVLEYVVVHELAHLVHFSHGERFWSLVEDHCPSARSIHRWLRREAWRLHLPLPCPKLEP